MGLEGKTRTFKKRKFIVMLCMTSQGQALTTLLAPALQWQPRLVEASSPPLGGSLLASESAASSEGASENQ